MDDGSTGLLARLLLDTLAQHPDLGGLTLRHMRFLMRVAEAEEKGHSIRAHDVAQDMDLQPSASSRIVSDLTGHSNRITQPLLIAEIDPENRRHRLLTLTKASRAMRQKNKKLIQKLVRELV